MFLSPILCVCVLMVKTTTVNGVFHMVTKCISWYHVATGASLIPRHGRVACSVIVDLTG